MWCSHLRVLLATILNLFFSTRLNNARLWECDVNVTFEAPSSHYYNHVQTGFNDTKTFGFTGQAGTKLQWTILVAQKLFSLVMYGNFSIAWPPGLVTYLWSVSSQKAFIILHISPCKWSTLVPEVSFLLSATEAPWAPFSRSSLRDSFSPLRGSHLIQK